MQRIKNIYIFGSQIIETMIEILISVLRQIIMIRPVESLSTAVLNSLAYQVSSGLPVILYFIIDPS